MSVAGVLCLRGMIDADRVRFALDALQARHEILRARIVSDRGRLWFDVSSDVPPIPLDVLQRRDESHWQDVAGQVINRNIDVETGPLVTCTYLTDTQREESDLVFGYDHSMMDAVSALRLYHQFMQLVTEDVDPTVSITYPLPPSIDQLLPEKLTGRSRRVALAKFIGSQAVDEIGYRRSAGGRRPRIQPHARCVTAIRALSAEETDSLVHQARHLGLTMNSVAAAALVAATYRNLYRGEKLPMRAVTFADLRPTLMPTPDADALGCYVSMFRHTLQVGPTDDLWSVARAFQEELRDSLSRDVPLLGTVMANRMMKLVTSTKRMRLGTTAVSYAGPLALSSQYGDIEILGVHGFISNNRLGPLATAFAKIYRGCLSWDMVFLDTDMSEEIAERIADTTVDVLAVAATP